MNDTQNVRSDQQREGLRMAHDGDSHPMDRHRPILRAPRGARAPGRKQNGPKGHEAFLKQLEESGTNVELEKMSGEKIVGLVRHSDKFTITLRVPQTGGGFHDRVIFKHDVSEFRSLQARKTEGEAE